MRIAFFVAVTLLFLSAFAGIALLTTNKRPPGPPRRPPIVIINATGAPGGWGAGPGPNPFPLPPQEEPPPYRIIGQAPEEDGEEASPPPVPLGTGIRPLQPRSVTKIDRPRRAHNRAEDPPELIADAKAGMSIRQLRRKWGIGYKRARRLVDEHRKEERR